MTPEEFDNQFMKQHSAKAAQAIHLYLVKEGIYLDERQAEQIAIAMEEHNQPLFDLIEKVRWIDYTQRRFEVIDATLERIGKP